VCACANDGDDGKRLTISADCGGRTSERRGGAEGNAVGPIGGDRPRITGTAAALAAAQTAGANGWGRGRVRESSSQQPPPPQSASYVRNIRVAVPDLVSARGIPCSACALPAPTTDGIRYAVDVRACVVVVARARSLCSTV